MSGDAILLERMSNAVRSAYKAMEVLKTENQNLKAENDSLRAQLSMLQTASSSVTNLVTGSPFTLSGEHKGVELKAAIVPVVQEPRAPVQLRAQVFNNSLESAVMLKELGNTRFSYKSFPNAPDANRFVTHLELLTDQNTHFLASTFEHQNPDTVCKALLLTISNYLKRDGNGYFTGVACVIPDSLLKRLDLMASMLVSLGSRSANGLVTITKLMAVLRKAILGSVRYQLSSPHYAVVMGALRVTPNNPSPQPCRNPAPEHTSPPLGTVASPATEPHVDLVQEDQSHEQTNPMDRKQRIAALASMIGLDSSSSDDDSNSGSGSGNEENSFAQKGRLRANSELIDVEETDAVDYHSDAESCSTRGSHSSKRCGRQPAHDLEGEVDGDADADGPAVGKEGNSLLARTKVGKEDACRGPLEQACRVYLLLATLLRLELYEEIVSTLEHMRVLTTHNFSEGCALGVLAVFGSPRYGTTHRADAVQALHAVVVAWLQISLRKTETQRTTPVAMTEPIREALRHLCGRFQPPGVTSQILDSASSSESTETQTTLQLLQAAEAVLRRAGESNEVAVPVEELEAAYRSVGFWGSVALLCPARGAHTVKPGRETVRRQDPFAVIGLDKAAAQAECWCAVLQTWDPAKSLAADRFQIGSLPSVAQFLQSDDFLLSSYQSHVFAALRSAGISPLKFAAQDTLVETFVRQWSKTLSSDKSAPSSQSSTSAARAALHALKTLRPLLHVPFSTEFDAAEGGWRTGLSGEGYRLQSRLDNRRTVGVALLDKLACTTHWRSSALGVVLKPALHWQHLSSCPGRNLLEYAQFVDHCAQEVFSNISSAEESVSTIETEAGVVQDPSVVKLYAVCTEMVALLALVAVENAAAVTVSSLRGLLCALYTQAHRTKTCTEESVALVQEVDRLLCAIPAPWAGFCRGDIRYELMRCTNAVLAAAHANSASSQLVRTLRLNQSVQLLFRPAQLPVFVINLDKRSDRLLRTLRMLDQAKVPVVRVCAWDGTGDASSASAAEMFHRHFGGGGGEGEDGSGGSNVPTVRKKDEYSDIPEREVALTWDSTLNAKFDARCAPNAAVIATASERACAASHLKAWRCIAEICGLKRMGRNGARHALGGGEATETENDEAAPTAVEIFRALKGSAGGHASMPDAASVTMVDANPLQQYFADASGGEYFVVFEDDVCFPQQSLVDLRATVRALMVALPADVDILYLGGLLPKASDDFKLQHKKNEPFFRINYVWTLQAYVLRRRAVEVLLSKLPIWAPVDNFVASLIYNGDLKACIAKEKVTQRIAPLSSSSRRDREDSDIKPSGRTLQQSSRKRAAPLSEKKNKKQGRR